MSEGIIIAIIAAVPPTAGIVVGIILAMRRIRSVGADVRQVGSNVESVHLTVNSRMDELLEATAALSRAEGRTEGVAASEREQESRSQPLETKHTHTHHTQEEA